MNLTVRDRIEKGLDRNGLIKAWNSISEKHENDQGLIMYMAEKDCVDMGRFTFEEYLAGFNYKGKSVTVSQAKVYIRHFNAVQKISENFKSHDGQPLRTLNEAKTYIQLPSSPEAYSRLLGENEKQKLTNYNDIKASTGKENPSVIEIREYNRAVKEQKEKDIKRREKLEEGKQIPKKLKKPDPFTFEEEVDFETWCISEHGFDVVAERPKHTRAIYALKDENVSNLFNRLDEWKSAYKIMAKLCHPDTGGNTLAMSFLSDLKDLMSALGGIKEVVDYDAKIEELRQEYSSPKAKEIENNL